MRKAPLDSYHGVLRITLRNLEGNGEKSVHKEFITILEGMMTFFFFCCREIGFPSDDPISLVYIPFPEEKKKFPGMMT